MNVKLKEERQEEGQKPRTKGLRDEIHKFRLDDVFHKLFLSFQIPGRVNLLLIILSDCSGSLAKIYCNFTINKVIKPFVDFY